MKKPNKTMLLLGSGYPLFYQSALIQTANELDYQIISASIDDFQSAERFCELFPSQPDSFVQNKTQITGSNVHVVMSMQDDPNLFFVDVLNTVSTLKEYGADKIHLILPYIPFARQDRPFKGRMVSQMGKTLATHLKFAGANQISTIDMHSVAAEGFYIDAFGAENMHFLTATPLFLNALQKHITPDRKLKFSGPDGADKPDDAAQRRMRHMEKLHYGEKSDYQENGFGISKIHVTVNTVKSVKAYGDAKDCHVALGDDMYDGCDTTEKAALVIKKDGAKEITSMATHGIFSNNSLLKVTADTRNGKQNPITRMMFTDSILGVYEKVKKLPEKQQQKTEIVSTLPLIQQALTLKL